MNNRLEGIISKDALKNRIMNNLDETMDLIGEINDVNCHENRQRLFDSYDLLFAIKSDLEKLFK